VNLTERLKQIKVNEKLWKPVTKKNQLKEGSIIKIIGLSEKDSYRRIAVKIASKSDSQTQATAA